MMKLSIIIPSYNGKLLLEKNLPPVIESLEYLKNSTEIIVVDDASLDGTSDWLTKSYPKIKIVKNQHNLRFGQSCNQGVNAASGELVVLLNNDVSPHRDFLVSLLKHFFDPEVFAVGCREINQSGGKEIIGGRGVSDFRRGLMIHWRPEDQNSPQSSWVSAGSAAYRRNIWLELGGMDKLFRPAYEEDRDLCWQALKSGYKVIFESKSVVTHYHETTNIMSFGRIAISLYSLKNQLLFVWKNVSSLRLMMNHFLWLPYHLIFSTIRSQGVFLVAFFLALLQLPEALKSRIQAEKKWIKSDEQILALANK